MTGKLCQPRAAPAGWASSAHCSSPPTACPPLSCAGGRAGSARPQHVVYLFHPVQPFLMAVLQDIETGLAERLALWARL